MGFIIWIIFIIWIVYAVNKNKNSQKHPVQNNGRPVQNNGRPVRNNGRPVQNTRKSQQARQTTAQNGADYGGSGQRELKERLAKKYNRPTEPDILAHARASVEQDFSDDSAAAAAYQKNEQPESTKQQDIKQQDLGLQGMQQSVLDAETEDVMKRVEELMVMGPDMKLSFSRDFVAEGMEMLGRIQG